MGVAQNSYESLHLSTLTKSEKVGTFSGEHVYSHNDLYYFPQRDGDLALSTGVHLCLGGGTFLYLKT